MYMYVYVYCSVFSSVQEMTELRKEDVPSDNDLSHHFIMFIQVVYLVQLDEALRESCWLEITLSVAKTLRDRASSVEYDFKLSYLQENWREQASQLQPVRLELR